MAPSGCCSAWPRRCALSPGPLQERRRADARPDEPASFELVAHSLRALTQLNLRINTGANAQEIAEFVDTELVDLDLSDDGESTDVSEAESDAAE